MKTLIGLFTSMLLSAGFVAGAPAANAACDSYAGCVDTATKATAPKVVQKRRKAQVCGSTRVVNSNATPAGSLRISVKRNLGGFKFTKTFTYTGGKTCVATKKLRKKGGYSVSVEFVPKPNSPFNPSSATTGFDVKG